MSCFSSLSQTLSSIGLLLSALSNDDVNWSLFCTYLVYGTPKCLAPWSPRHPKRGSFCPPPLRRGTVLPNSTCSRVGGSHLVVCCCMARSHISTFSASVCWNSRALFSAPPCTCWPLLETVVIPWLPHPAICRMILQTRNTSIWGTWLWDCKLLYVGAPFSHPVFHLPANSGYYFNCFSYWDSHEQAYHVKADQFVTLVHRGVMYLHSEIGEVLDVGCRILFCF